MGFVVPAHGIIVDQATQGTTRNFNEAGGSYGQMPWGLAMARVTRLALVAGL